MACLIEQPRGNVTAYQISGTVVIAKASSPIAFEFMYSTQLFKLLTWEIGNGTCPAASFAAHILHPDTKM